MSPNQLGMKSSCSAYLQLLKYIVQNPSMYSPPEISDFYQHLSGLQTLDSRYSRKKCTEHAAVDMNVCQQVEKHF